MPRNTEPDPTQRLATYGTLAPGRPNAHHLASIDGTWSTGTVRGHLIDAGWGADAGYPGIILDDNGPMVSVFVLESKQLAAHWQRLDDFEGPEYRRVETIVDVAGHPVTAYMYALDELTAGSSPTE